MAKVYRTPGHLKPPSLGMISSKEGTERYVRELDEHIAEVQAWARENGKGPLRGEVVRFPVADGSAVYVVMSGTQLIWIEGWDSYSIPEAHARGLRAQDIKEHVQYQRKLDELFS